MTDPTSPASPDASPQTAAEVAMLNAYLDGELSAADIARVEALLDSSGTARVLLKSLSVQRDALATRFSLPVDCPVTQALVSKVLAGEWAGGARCRTDD